MRQLTKLLCFAVLSLIQAPNVEPSSVYNGTATRTLTAYSEVNFGGASGGGGGPLSVDSQMPSGTCVNTAASPWTWSFNNVAGTVLYLFISMDSVTLSNTANISTASATYGGTAMTQIGRSDDRGNSPAFATAFRLTLPATGANNFVVTWGPTTTVVIGCAISLKGNHARPDSGMAVVNNWLGNVNNTFALNNTPTVSGDIVLQYACYGDAPRSTQSGTLSSFLEVNSGATCNNAELQVQTAGAGTTNTSITAAANTSFITLGIDVRAAATPASQITPLPTSTFCVGYSNGVSVNSISCTWTSAPPAGSSLVCGGRTGGTNAITGLSISDGTSFTNSQAPRNIAGTNEWLILSYRFNIGVAAPSPVTMTIASGGTDPNAEIACTAFKDNSGTPSADGVCTFDTVSNVSTPVSCTSAIVTTGLDYVVSYGVTFASITKPTAGWGGGPYIDSIGLNVQIQSAAGSITPTVDVVTGHQVGLNGFAIRPATALLITTPAPGPRARARARRRRRRQRDERREERQERREERRE